MNDLISRQAAIYALSMMHGIVAEEGVRKGISMAWQQIKDLPSAQPEQRWIPCSERLPEETATYICTCFDGIANRVTFINFQKRYATWNLTGQRAYWKVIAWQPLPEPWKGE